MLIQAKKNKKAIIHFNINNLEWTKSILEECNLLNIPVILGVSESSVEYMGGYNTVFGIVKNLIIDLNIKIDVVLHLDHGKKFESCQRAIDAGFTSVMIDASKEKLSKNIEITKKVVEYAHARNVTVEAEIGIMGEVNNNNIEFGREADIIDIITFVKETNIDSVASSFGTVHGIYKKKLNINYNLIKELANQIEIPLVLHGGSGLSNEILKKCVESGITKININSDLQDKWSKSVREYLLNNKDVIDPRKIISSGMKDLKKEIDLKININN